MFEVILKDRTRELVDGADAYRQEGQMTTFFQYAANREVIDSWSRRVASIRTSEVLIIRRLPEPLAIPDFVNQRLARSA
jgi:hypothetical protein